ncbi:MAG: lipid-binding protein [Flavobacteriaceae bacterium]|nr:lipid-binding protein [Flavobacteriaceae bacterium]|tara:strand:- start:4118 stop:4687 length:570 start_codon:yes stop_codon:yes gene_type:complete
MKIFQTLFLFFLINSFFVSAQTAELNVDNSTLKWTGKKITTESHWGSLKFKNGSVVFSNGIIKSGKFIVDMTTINVEDIQGRGKARLEGHLKGDQFFSVENHNEASLEINSSTKNADGLKVSGVLTIKGIASNVEFVMILDEAANSWNSKLTFDRAKHNVRFRSGSFFENLGDKLILDDIDLEATLSFN